MPEESYKREDIKVSRHTEQQRLQSLKSSPQRGGEFADGRRETSPDSLVFPQEYEIKHVIVSERETIQSIDNQNQLQGNKYAPTSKSKISVLPQGVDMRSNSSPQRGEEAIPSEQKRTLGVQVRGSKSTNSPQSSLKKGGSNSHHTEEQHLPSAECWLKTQAFCKTFQPNVGTFNSNVVIGKRKYPVTNTKELSCKKDNYIEINNQLDCFGSKEPHNDDVNSVILSDSERSQNREDFTNNAILRGLNNCSPQKDCKLAERTTHIANSNNSRKVAFTEPSRGMSGAKVEQTSAETLSFRCVCERCRLTRGEVRKTTRKVAFTLAEVLITLGIIGVVAALTLPSVIANYRKQMTVNKLKSTYSLLYNAFEMAKNDYGLDVNQWELPISTDTKITSDYFAEKYLIPYLKVVNDCKSGKPRECLPTNMSHARVFILTNGAIISVYVSHNGDLRVQISMYLNGYKNQNPARDVFLIELGGGSGGYGSADKNKFFPYGYGAGSPRIYYTTRAGNTACTKSGNKSRCFALIMHDGWKIADDYPW